MLKVLINDSEVNNYSWENSTITCPHAESNWYKIQFFDWVGIRDSFLATICYFDTYQVQYCDMKMLEQQKNCICKGIPDFANKEVMVVDQIAMVHMQEKTFW